MTVNEAIEYLDLEAKGLMDYNDPKWAKAVKLGINALIFYRKVKALNTGEIQGNFIGETE